MSDPRFSDTMSDLETLMWNIEADPMLSATIGTVCLLDRPVDAKALRRRIAAGVAAVPRLRERVVPGTGLRAPPAWRTDVDFELDYHLRHLAMPGRGRLREVLDLATRLLQDPFDRTRPLWQFYAVDGVERDRGALIVKLHHSITDGEGGLLLAEQYLDLERKVPKAHKVDLASVIAEAAAAEREDADDESGAGDAASSALRGGLEFLRRTAAEAAMAMADPLRVTEVGETVADNLKWSAGQLQADGNPSPLWATRSRKRHVEVLGLDFATSKDAAKSLGGTLNDFFVTGALLGAIGYHEAFGTQVDELTVTFVVSTRSDDSPGGNSFTPARASLPAGPMSITDRFQAVAAALHDHRDEAAGGGFAETVAGVANLLPTSVVTRFARTQARGIDFATSNLRAAPFPFYVAGAKILAIYPIGPVAGTAWNITVMSYDGHLDMAVHIDPVAVSDPSRLRTCLQRGFEELIAAAADGR